jgi:hypothetical protein
MTAPGTLRGDGSRLALRHPPFVVPASGIAFVASSFILLTSFRQIEGMNKSALLLARMVPNWSPQLPLCEEN